MSRRAWDSAKGSPLQEPGERQVGEKLQDSSLTSATNACKLKHTSCHAELTRAVHERECGERLADRHITWHLYNSKHQL